MDGKRMWAVVMRSALFAGIGLTVAGCATVEYVDHTIRDMLAPVGKRVGDLERNAASEKARLDQVAAQVVQAQAAADAAGRSANEAKQQAAAAAAAAQQAGAAAQQAGAAAQQAGAKADAVDGRLSKVLANRYKRNPVQQVDLSFATGKSALSNEAQAALQGVLKVLADNATYTADVVAYTDQVGDPEYNIDLAWYREEAVRRFLVEKGAALNRIVFIGIGEEMAKGKTAAERAKDRHVSVQIFSPAD